MTSRRRLLATLGAGLATGLAGCGYQPGAGDLAWTTELGGSGLSHRTGSREWLETDAFLVAVRNRSGRRFDHDEGEFVDVSESAVTVVDRNGKATTASTDAQFDGVPAATVDGIYVPREDGRVVALDRPESAGRGDERDGADDPRRWRTDEVASPLALTAGAELVVGIHEDGVVAIDADDGDRRFDLPFEDVPFETVAAVTVGRSHVWLADGAGTLHCLDADGSSRASLSLPTEPSWLGTVGDRALVALATDGGVVRGIEPDGRSPFDLEIDGVGALDPLLVDDRLYHARGDGLVAVDVDSGERRWKRENPFRSGDVVADETGLYGFGTLPGGDCGLVAIDHDGEDRWSASVPDEPGCSGELSVLEDRLVVVDGSVLYGFRTEPGRRYTLV